MRAARFMKWIAVPRAWLAVILAIIIGVGSEWYFGVGFFVVTLTVLFVVGYSKARCPRCGQVWGSSMGALTFAPWWAIADEAAEVGDETETFVCRRCRLDIGLGLRET
jgi:hypothetical protein